MTTDAISTTKNSSVVPSPPVLRTASRALGIVMPLATLAMSNGVAASRYFENAISDTQAVTAELRERKAIIADAQSAIQRIDEATAAIAQLSRTTTDVVGGDGKRMIRNLADAADETKAAAKDVRAMITGLQAPASDFATNGLPQITAAVIQLQTAAESLERLVNEVESSPTGALGKASAQEVKVPQ